MDFTDVNPPEAKVGMLMVSSTSSSGSYILCPSANPDASSMYQVFYADRNFTATMEGVLKFSFKKGFNLYKVNTSGVIRLPVNADTTLFVAKDPQNN